MSGPGFQLSLLRDGRLAPLATSALPAWLWRPDGTRIVWANAAGVAVFGATFAAIGSRRCARGEPAADQIARIAASLPAPLRAWNACADSAPASGGH